MGLLKRCIVNDVFASTVTLGSGVDIMTVNKMPGHKNWPTTRIYSKVTEPNIADDMKKLL